MHSTVLLVLCLRSHNTKLSTELYSFLQTLGKNHFMLFEIVHRIQFLEVTRPVVFAGYQWGASQFLKLLEFHFTLPPLHFQISNGKSNLSHIFNYLSNSSKKKSSMIFKAHVIRLGSLR